MAKVIGIRSWTTNSCVAIMEGSDPKVLTNAEGTRTTPSVVAFSESGERLLGQIARRQAITNPQNTVFAVKRLIGRVFGDAMVQKAVSLLPYKIARSDKGDAWVESRGKTYSPAEISAFILQKMKQTAEDYLGEPVTEAVITVPAYFNDSQRQATKDAGRIAGLDVLRIINEPTAASLAYGLDKQQDEKIAVFDLGGGTFDISILELGDASSRSRLPTATPSWGRGLRPEDHRLPRGRVQEGPGHRPARRPDALQRLKEAAEKAKCELSTSVETDINLPFITADQTGPKHMSIKLSRSKLEALCADLIERTEEPCRQALSDAGFSAGEINEVILVGGMTRMPAVQERVKEDLREGTPQGVNPDEGGGHRRRHPRRGCSRATSRTWLLLDVTPLSLGIETWAASSPS